MKKLIALCAVMSVATVFADDISFGCLRVDSSAPETIVSIPWIGAGVSGEAIKVADIVKTTNLTEGDELWWYDGSQGVYFTWKLANGVWVEQPTVINNESKTPTSANKQILARGNAILLIRKGSSIANCFYLYGQVPTSTDIGEIQLGVGTDEAPCYTLLAPPSVTETNINFAKWSNVANNDYILVVDEDGVQHQLFYADSNWGTRKGDTNVAKVLAGQGAWFVSAKAKKDTEKEAARVDWNPKAN